MLRSTVIRVATEEDISDILDIELEAIAPPWTHGALLGEIYRGDSFFTVACEECVTLSSESGDVNASIYGRGRLAKQETSSENRSSESHPESERTEKNGPTVLGFLILRKMGDDGELLQIAVRSAARRRGVADLLMGAMLQYASENALKSIFLEVRRSNDSAIGLYKKHGFKTVRMRKGYYNSPVEDALIMTRTLHSP